MVETSTNRNIKWLRSDNDDEYESYLFIKLCWNEGIVQYFTIEKRYNITG